MKTTSMHLTSLVFSIIALCLASCGGGSSSDSAAPRNIQVRVQEPADLQTLPADKRITSVSLVNLEDGIEGNTAADMDLSPNPDLSAYNGAIPSLAPARYLLRITLSQPFDPSTVLVDGVAEAGAVQNIVVAVAEQPIDVVVGENTIIVDTKPTDFSTSINDDGDDLTNLQEFLGTTDPAKRDTDSDGVADGQDTFPNNSSESKDTDADEIGDNEDLCPAVADADQKDTNRNGVGDACDSDIDGDGLSNANEANLGTDPANPDSDTDGVCDGPATVKTASGGTICASLGGLGDNCPLIPNPDQANHGIHALGDACDADSDGDGIPNGLDNCPFAPNPDQANHGNNGDGDACHPDIDSDGVLNGQDNCPFSANAGQGDVNQNGIGDICDPDADSDGLSSVEENTPGVDGLITNWLSVDTDGDGIPDSLDNCQITPNPVQASNGDSDGEGDSCDCDPNDSNIVTGSAVFVSVNGDDFNTGARNDPLKTIQKAVQVAEMTGKSQIYIGAGIYSGNLVMADGISVLGGFNVSNDGSNCSKKLANAGTDINQTIITAASGPTISFADITLETRLEGVIVQSTAMAGDQVLVSITSSAPSSQNDIIIEDSYLEAPSIPLASVIAVSVDRASPVFMNCVIDAGDSQESTAVALVNSPAAKFVHNTIRGGGSSSTSTAVDSVSSVPSLVNNILFTDAGNTQRILYFRDPNPSASILCKNNLVFGVQGASPDQPKLYQASNPAIHIYTTVTQVNNADGNNAGGPFAGNIRLTSDGTDAGTLLQLPNLFQDPANNFRLIAGALALNRGLNPATAIGINVLKDHDSTVRPQGMAPDLGAFEKVP